jgi:hypothetical protein
LGVSSSIRRASNIAVLGCPGFWSVTISTPHVAAFHAEFNSFYRIQLSQPVLEILIFVGNIWLGDLALTDFGSFRIRSAISVRSIGLGRFDGHTTISSQVCNVGTPQCWPDATQDQGVPLYFGPVPLVLWPT